METTEVPRPQRRPWYADAGNAITGLAAAVFVVPIVVDLITGDRTRKLFAQVAADTFYYLTVARHMAQSGSVSFDGEHVTNGFHPFWQILTALIALFLRVTSGGAVLYLLSVVAMGIFWTLLAIVLLALAFRSAERLSVAFLVVPLGVASFVQVPIMWHLWRITGRPTTTLWGAVNGMETSLVLAMYAAAAYAYLAAPRTPRGGALFGCALAALTFARLDHGAFAVFMLALPLFEKNARAFLTTAAAVFAGALGIYVLINESYMGMAVPVSGALKSTFPQVATVNADLIRTLMRNPKQLPPLHGHRALQMILPAAVASLYVSLATPGFLWTYLRRKHELSERSPRFELLLLASAFGVLSLFSYNYLFVPKMNQGHWYFPVSQLFVSLAFLRALQMLPWSVRLTSPVGLALATLLVAVQVGGYLKLVKVGPRDGSKMTDFCIKESEKVRAFYAGQLPRITELDDGVVTFCTGMPALSGMGLAVDAEAVAAAGGIGKRRTGRNKLVELGVARGYDRFSSLMYIHARLDRKSSSAEIRRVYNGVLNGQVSRCSLKVEYASENGTFSIIRPECRRKVQ